MTSTTQMQQSAAECFLCCGDQDPLLSVCQCETKVHEDCFLRMVSEVRAHRTLCPVCRTPYPIVTRTKKKWSIPTCRLVTIDIAFGMVTILVLFASTSLDVRRRFSLAFLLLLGLFGFLGTLAFLAHSVHYRTNRSIVPCLTVSTVHLLRRE